MHIINTVYGSARGGRWQVLVDYSRWLREENHQVTVIIDPRATEPTDEIITMGCRIIHIKNTGFYDPLSTLKAWSCLSKLKPDAILSHGGRSTCLFKRAKTKKTPLVAINHSNNIKRTLGADIFFNISKHIQQLIEARSHSKLHYRVFNSPRHTQTSSPLENSGITKIAFMGRLTKQKGVDIMLRALAKLRDEKIIFHCKIAGEGEELYALESLIQELSLASYVDFVGQIDNPVEFLAAAHIFCFPTLGEGFPISPIEAFAAGCAVVGTDDAGTAELLEHGALGIVVPRGDVNTLADALKTLIQSPERRLELATKAQAKYLTTYTPENAKQQFISVLGQCIEDYKARIKH